MSQDLTEDRWRRLEELFHAACELPGEAREPFIQLEAAGDDDLRRQLKGMLAHADGAPELIAKTIQLVAVEAVCGADWLGRRVGPYRLVREVGRGGMGLVFEAVRDDDEYRKTVALKIAPWWRDLDLLRERFRSERQMLAGLEHPNIARFLDGGTHTGIPYFAMEYVEGCAITEYAERHGLKLAEKIELFRQVCAAVQYAHQSLLVHRDLKPANILVSEEGVPKLLDFGIAKLLSPLPDAGQNTLTGGAPWTPDYASPEQVRAGPITTRTDVYSLGLILFELLTGARAQIADTSSPLALDRSICEAETPPASARAPRAVARQLSGDLDTIVAMATHKDPQRRYSSAAELSDDLGRYLTDRPVLACKDSMAYRASKFLRRNWLPTSAAAVTALSLIAGAVGFAWQARVAERRFDQVRKLATTFLFDVHDNVRTLPGATAVREMITRTAVESLGSLSRDAGNNYALRRELAAAYLRLGMVQGGQTGASLGKHGEALASFERGLSLLHGIPANELAAAAQTEAGLRENFGRLLVGTSRASEVEPELQRAVEIRSRLCRDAVKDKGPCVSRMSPLIALVELGVRQRRVDATEGYLRELDQTIESLRPVLSLSEYQGHWLRSRMLRARMEWIRPAPLAAADLMVSALPVVEELVAAKGGDLDTLRVAVNYCVFYGSIADQSSDPRMERVFRHALEWSEQLIRLDPLDRRSRTQAASITALWGKFLSRDDPVRGIPLLRRATHEFLDNVRLAPAAVDLIALLVDSTDQLVKADVRSGRERDAVDDARDALQLYDPLMMVGLKLERSETVREIQAREWVAKQRSALTKAASAWDTDAAHRADSALERYPSDPALQATAAGLYANLPGSPEDRLRCGKRATALWQSLAARFPTNETLRARVK